MKANHTPGPWYVGETNTDNGKIYSHEKMPFIATAFQGTVWSPKEWKANAKLIAAAPELLEACRQALFAIPTTHAAFETVRAAIAKAEVL
jgi:hypothetical protein